MVQNHVQSMGLESTGTPKVLNRKKGSKKTINTGNPTAAVMISEVARWGSSTARKKLRATTIMIAKTTNTSAVDMNPDITSANGANGESIGMISSPSAETPPAAPSAP